MSNHFMISLRCLEEGDASPTLPPTSCELHPLHIPHSTFHVDAARISTEPNSYTCMQDLRAGETGMNGEISMTNLCHSEDDTEDSSEPLTHPPRLISSSISFPVFHTGSPSREQSGHTQGENSGHALSARGRDTTSLSIDNTASETYFSDRQDVPRAIETVEHVRGWRSGFVVDQRNFEGNDLESFATGNPENATLDEGKICAPEKKTNHLKSSNMSRLCHSQPSSPVTTKAHNPLQPTIFSGPLPHHMFPDGDSIPDATPDLTPQSGTARNRRGNYRLFRTWSTGFKRSLSFERDNRRHGAVAHMDEDGDYDYGLNDAEITELSPAERDVSATRYFDALKGPELEVPKDLEDLLLPSDELWPFLLRFPIGVFRISLGLGCQCILWKDLHNVSSVHFLHIPKMVHFGIWWVALVTLIMLSVIYIAKCIMYFEAVRREFHHPVRVNYFFTPWIAGMFLAQSSPSETEGVRGPIVWAILMAPIIALELKIYGQWLSGGERRLSKVANPSTHMSVVGNFAGAKLAAIIGWSEVAILFWAIGLAHYLVLFVTLYQRLPTNVVLPKELHPVYFLFVAVPSSASVAWKYIIGTFGSLSKIFFFVSLFLYALLGIRFNFFLGSRFSVAWWAYTFPMSVAAIASIHYSQEVTSHLTQGLAILLSLVASVTVLGLFCLTFLHAVVWRSLFPNDMAIAITATKHHRILNIKKKHSHKLSPHDPSSDRHPDFKVNEQPDLVLGKILSPNIAKLFSISSADQSSVTVDMMER